MEPRTLLLFDADENQLAELEADTFREAYDLACERANCFHVVWINPEPACGREGCNVCMRITRYEDTREAALPMFHSAIGESIDELQRDVEQPRCTACAVACMSSLSGTPIERTTEA